MKLSELEHIPQSSIDHLTRPKHTDTTYGTQPYYNSELGIEMIEVLKMYKADKNMMFQWNWNELGYKSATMKARLHQALNWACDNCGDAELATFARRVSIRKTDNYFFFDLNPEGHVQPHKQSSLLAGLKMVPKVQRGLGGMDNDRAKYIGELKEAFKNWLEFHPINTTFRDSYPLSEDDIAWFCRARDEYKVRDGIKGRANSNGLKMTKTA